MSRRNAPDWQPLTEVDERDAEHHGVFVESYRLQLLSGVERKNLFLDTKLLANIGVTVQTDFVVLANLRDGETSRPDYAVGSLEDAQPSIGSMILGTRKTPLAEAYVSDDMFCGDVDERLVAQKALVILVNTNEIWHRISMRNDQSATDPRVWAGYLNSAIHSSLDAVEPSNLHWRTFKKLRRRGRFVAPRLLTPPSTSA